MVWFKVDDNLAFHQKSLRAGNAAMGLWVRAGSWCAQHLTDGYVPADIAGTLGTKAEANRLVAADLWLQLDDGFEFWQWGEDGRQPTRAEVEEKRKATRERQRRAREKAMGITASVTRDETRDGQRDDARTDSVSHAAPDPTRPDPTHKDSTPAELISIDPKPAKPTDRFDEFWSAYPKRVAKAAARRRWATLMTNRVDPQAIIDGATAYAAEVRGKDREFVKQPDGWLLAGRWEDEPATPTSNGEWWNN
jgi:hypothetical protein